MIFNLIRQSSKVGSIKQMTSLLSVSRSSYYRWIGKGAERESTADIELRSRIQRIALKWPCYGYRRITAALHREGTAVNRKKVLQLMRRDNLLCLRRRKFLRTTRSDHDFPVFPNLIRGLKVTSLNQLWVADITYIRLPQEFVYLAVILDAFSRKCIGWALERYLDTLLSLAALRKAIKRRNPLPGTIHHSDRGVQYAAREYVDLLLSNGFVGSMSRKGNPYDNAQAESFMKTLKYEEVHLFEYNNIVEAQKRIRFFIEDVYNRKRLHSSLNYLPPAEFEERIDTTTIVLTNGGQKIEDFHRS